MGILQVTRMDDTMGNMIATTFAERGDITENMIRAEHLLPQRIRYGNSGN